ncbi:MAG TPA: esterase-like activity of phytase family protein [Croceibacterium sp.]|nr:esterase-like activity of phytase family protein [Croceibacterium sp.]
MRRLFLLLLVMAGLAPGTWVRSPPEAEEADYRQILALEPLAVPVARLGRFRVAGVWSLSSPNSHFGGYSALLALPDGSLLAASDHGRLLRFTPPGRPGRTVRLDYFIHVRWGEKTMADIEGLTRDPESGALWAAYEQQNMIARYTAARRSAGQVFPGAMRNWPSNTGPEAIVRLGDGRFVVLAEGSPRWFARDLPALLFPGDPVAGAEPVRFRFRPPRGFRPVDIAQLPDGRALVLVRRFTLLPPSFSGKLVLVDPAEIRAGKTWRGEVVAELAEPLPSDNYEGLAIEPAAGGGVVVWVISDDNASKLQRTLLLKLEWRPPARARATGRAPR